MSRGEQWAGTAGNLAGQLHSSAMMILKRERRSRGLQEMSIFFVVVTETLG